VAVTFRQGDRGTTGSARTISTVADNTLGLSGTVSGNVGDMIELSGTGGAGNDGVYTVVEFVGGSPSATVRVRPTPNATSGGTAQMRTRTNTNTGRTIAASTISDVTPIGENLAVVTVVGATFRDLYQIRPNDRLAISGATGISMDTSGGTNPGGAPTFAFATGPDTIQRSAGDWTSDGFQVGDHVVVTGTVSNNGTHGPISGFTTTATHNDTLQIGSTLTAEGPLAATITSGTALTFTAGTPHKITRSRGSWIDEGFQVDQFVTVTGTASNSGRKGPITAITDTVIDMTAGLAAEGPVVTTAATADPDNNGGWFLHGDPLSNDRIVVRAPDGGPGLSAGSDGTLALRHGITRITVDNEADMDFAELTGDPALTFTTGTPDKLVRDAGSWVDDGFATGQTVHIDGNLTVDANNVNNAVITGISTTTITNDTLEFAGGTFSAGSTISTGGWVETPGITWNWIRENATPATAPNNFFGSGEIRDYVRRFTPGARYGVTIAGVGRVDMDFSSRSQDCVWSSQNEVMINDRQTSPGSGGDAPNGGNRLSYTYTPNGANINQVRLGRQIGDEFSAKQGSTNHGVRFHDSGRWRSYGSYTDTFGPQFQNNDDDHEFTASIVRDSYRFDGDNLRIHASIFYGTSPFLLLGSISESVALIVSSATTVAAITSTITLDQLLMGADAKNAWGSSGNITMLDPLVDISFPDYSSTGGSLSYRYNPSFVSAGAPSEVGIPLENMVVKVFEISSAGAEVEVFTGTTNSSGKLNGGAGTNLRREDSAGNLYTHRLLLEGPGVRRINAPFTMVAPVLGDLNVATLTPNWEGEFESQ
jgi:hypothetical protein